VATCHSLYFLYGFVLNDFLIQGFAGVLIVGKALSASSPKEEMIVHRPPVTKIELQDNIITLKQHLFWCQIEFGMI
jgi:hypothetical protein